jgi:hypothetical protein
MSRSSNSEGCNGPSSAASRLIAGARSAVIQSRPAGRSVCSMRALVSVTNTIYGTASWTAILVMHLMVCVWLIFAALLFVIEPLIIRRTVDKRATAAPQATLTRMLWMHRVMLALSLLAIFAAIGGSHGLF